MVNSKRLFHGVSDAGRFASLPGRCSARVTDGSSPVKQFLSGGGCPQPVFIWGAGQKSTFQFIFNSESSGLGLATPCRVRRSGGSPIQKSCFQNPLSGEAGREENDGFVLQFKGNPAEPTTYGQNRLIALESLQFRHIFPEPVTMGQNRASRPLIPSDQIPTR